MVIGVNAAWICFMFSDDPWSYDFTPHIMLVVAIIVVGFVCVKKYDLRKDDDLWEQ